MTLEGRDSSWQSRVGDSVQSVRSTATGNGGAAIASVSTGPPRIVHAAATHDDGSGLLQCWDADNRDAPGDQVQLRSADGSYGRRGIRGTDAGRRPAAHEMERVPCALRRQPCADQYAEPGGS